MPLYKHRPDQHVVAVQWNGTTDAIVEIGNLIGKQVRTGVSAGGGYTYITFDGFRGEQRAEPGDWIINGALGRCYVVSQDTFDIIYELIDPDPDLVPEGTQVVELTDSP
jgi:hypothetical protein